MALMNDVYSYIENNYQTNESIFWSGIDIPRVMKASVCSAADEEADGIRAAEAF